MTDIKLLLVEDDPLLGEALHEALSRQGYLTRLAASGAAALAASSDESFDLVLQDVRLPDADGLDILCEILALQPHCHALVMTGQATVEMAVRAMKLGAFDFITKPFPVDVLLMKLERLMGLRSMEKQLADLTGASDPRSRIITRSPAMRGVLDTIAVVAASEASVLLLGESGTGKELLAETVHAMSPRCRGPLVRVNCAAIPETLIEAELFGVEKGAYTGADRSRPGYLELADGGTLFLDEIGELTAAVQAKLLRALGERTAARVGGAKTYGLDFRLVCATNRDLRAMVTEREFREDLYYRINVVALTVPPLRDRREDIPLLAAHFIDRFARERQSPIRLTPEALQTLLRLPWSGNVRELANLMEQLSVLYPGQHILQRHIPRVAAIDPQIGTIFERITVGMPLKEALAEFEKRYIQRVLAGTGGRKGRCAEILGLSRQALWDKLRDASALIGTAAK
ncbi:MAG: sigma-54-dependent Fis family transcriptional regulator [Geobacteraceae bacterium GWC2_58_44]|nr:MAG: sigma-54-dependent Fis family transcriptional regulator [Geobacteraceae bacterium GWC2_58_44]